jgi:hypothetical protein
MAHMSPRTALKREVRVAFSPRAQPAWFRLLKWVAALGVSAALWRSRYFWWWIGLAVTLGVTVHLIWRWKTRGWTQPWGGWSDVAATKDD